MCRYLICEWDFADTFVLDSVSGLGFSRPDKPVFEEWRPGFFEAVLAMENVEHV